MIYQTTDAGCEDVAVEVVEKTWMQVRMMAEVGIYLMQVSLKAVYSCPGQQTVAAPQVVLRTWISSRRRGRRRLRREWKGTCGKGGTAMRGHTGDIASTGRNVASGRRGRRSRFHLLMGGSSSWQLAKNRTWCMARVRHAIETLNAVFPVFMPSGRGGPLKRTPASCTPAHSTVAHSSLPSSLC